MYLSIYKQVTIIVTYYIFNEHVNFPLFRKKLAQLKMIERKKK